MGNDSVKIAAAMAAGYLLGRTKKARFVFAVAGGVMMAGRGLARLGLDQSRLGGVLTEVLGDVQRSAGEALNARVGKLGDTLRSQTENLGGVLSHDEDEDQSAGEEGEEEEGEEDEGEEEAPDEGRARDEDSDGAGEDEEAPAPSRAPDPGRSARSGGRRVAQAAGRGRR